VRLIFLSSFQAAFEITIMNRLFDSLIPMPTDHFIFVRVRLADDRIVKYQTRFLRFPKTEPTASPHAVNLESRFKVYAKQDRMSSGLFFRNLIVSSFGESFFLFFGQQNE
jgi:hypothetical protein